MYWGLSIQCIKCLHHEGEPIIVEALVYLIIIVHHFPIMCFLHLVHAECCYSECSWEYPNIGLSFIPGIIIWMKEFCSGDSFSIHFKNVKWCKWLQWQLWIQREVCERLSTTEGIPLATQLNIHDRSGWRNKPFLSLAFTDLYSSLGRIMWTLPSSVLLLGNSTSIFWRAYLQQERHLDSFLQSVESLGRCSVLLLLSSLLFCKVSTCKHNVKLPDSVFCLSVFMEWTFWTECWLTVNCFCCRTVTETCDVR